MASSGTGDAPKAQGKFELRPPPYPLDALAPYMSLNTLEFHWGKHHRAYVDNLNKQVLGTELGALSLEDVIVKTYNNGDLHPAFNNAAQVWNHDFFWDSMKPGGGGKPEGRLLKLIERDFGSYDAFEKEFRTAAISQFGSGWAWLIYKADAGEVKGADPVPLEKDYKLAITKTPNAVNPLVWDYSTLLTVDVWEHAYYLDYQNRRPDYVSVFLEKLISWDAVSARLEAAEAKAVEKAKGKL
ncbi:unnamed protein product [Victoria cruziana]